MTVIWKLMLQDIRRITSNVVSVIVVLGLVTIPGLFTWFNVAASWDPFANTNHLTFAVASEDAGYTSDLIPTKITVGDQVLSQLRENSELNWVFTNSSDAVEGTKSGKYYAAVVIDKNFSRDLMTFFSDDVHHGKLTYYTNEKKNALAPKVTGQGADQMAAQVNQVFATTIATVGLTVAKAVTNEMSTPDAESRVRQFNDNIADFASQLSDTAAMLQAYGTLTDGAQTLLAGSYDLLTTTSADTTAAAQQLKKSQQGVADITEAASSASSTMLNALNTSSDAYGAVADDLDDLYASSQHSAGDISQSLRDRADAIDKEVAAYQSLQKQLAAMDNPAIQNIADSLQTIIDQQKALSDSLNESADQVDASSQQAQAAHAQAKALAQQAQQSIDQLKLDVNTTLKPQIDQVVKSLNDGAAALSTGVDGMSSAVNALSTSVDGAGSSLTTTKEIMDSTASLLTSTSHDLTAFNTRLRDALDSGDMDKVRTVLSADPADLAAKLSHPVDVKRTAVFPVESFGAALTPFYSFIPLWVGSLLLAVTLKTTVSRRTRRMLGNPKPHELFLGHFGVFAAISLLQSTFIMGGDLLFLRVHAVHPWLFMLSGWVSGLVYAFFIYALVVSFGNVGKAIGVIMLVIQISGSGGAYPLQVLPGFISNISPFLPVHHSVQAMRAAIAGIYMNDYTTSMLKLLAFVPPMLLLGLLLRKPLTRFNRWYVTKLESTKLL